MRASLISPLATSRPLFVDFEKKISNVSIISNFISSIKVEVTINCVKFFFSFDDNWDYHLDQSVVIVIQTREDLDILARDTTIGLYLDLRVIEVLKAAVKSDS